MCWEYCEQSLEVKDEDTSELLLDENAEESLCCGMSREGLRKKAFCGKV